MSVSQLDNKTKSLLLGVSLRWREEAEGIKVWDEDRFRRLSDALDRLEIEVDQLEPDTLWQMLDSGEEVLEWLATHPTAIVRLGSWSVLITSPDFADVDYERFDCPFGLKGAVEDFTKGKCGSGWSCEWSLC